MRMLAMSAISAVALVGFAAPVMAHPSGWQSRHDWQHDQLDRQHDDAHDQLDAEHAAAHEEGLTPWEHAQLHRELQYQHDQADYQIQRQHARQHRRDAWRRSSGYGYGSYGSYGY